MAIHYDIHHADMNRVGILCNQVSPFSMPLHFRCGIFGNQANACRSPEQFDSRFDSDFQRVIGFVARRGGNIFNIQPKNRLTIFR